MSRRTFISVLALSTLSIAVAMGALAQKPSKAAPQAESADPPLAAGRQLFETRCAVCHAIDGRGGERGPDIATHPAVLQRTDAALAQIVRSGIPAGGMPAFSTIDEATLKSVIAYLRVLQGKGGAAKLPGNPQLGESVFFGKGGCAECHIISGKGGFLASDLSPYAKGRSVNEIRDAIVKPSDATAQAAAVVVTTRDGRKITGIVRNEDNFSLQLQALDGAFHLFLKSELDSMTRQPTPLMPTDYDSTLSAQELNDLISYLMSVAAKDTTPIPKKQFREDEENE